MAKAIHSMPQYKEGKLKTEKQWLELGYKPKNKNVKGTKYWINEYYRTSAIYFLDTEVKLLTDRQKAEIRRKERIAKEKRKKEAAALAERIKKEQEAWETQTGTKSLMKGKEIVTADHILFDLETTGLYAGEDEILQLAIIDIDGNVLYNDYFQPEHRRRWPDAARINGIYPEDVIGYRLIRDALPEIQQIFSAAKTITGFNILGFDLNFLHVLGIKFNEKTSYYDVMLEATIGGEKWPKLSEAASVIGYDWKSHGEAHNALADCYATLEVYGSLLDGSYFRIKEERRKAYEERIAKLREEWRKKNEEERHKRQIEEIKQLAEKNKLLTYGDLIRYTRKNKMKQQRKFIESNCGEFFAYFKEKKETGGK